jgi:hypothetical protein
MTFLTSLGWGDEKIPFNYILGRRSQEEGEDEAEKY